MIHYYLLVKSDTRVPLRYAAIVALLLGWRAVFGMRQAFTREKDGA